MKQVKQVTYGKHSSYKDLLIWLKKAWGTDYKYDWRRAPGQRDPGLKNLKDFCSQYSHNDNDGDWSKGYYSTDIRVIGTDENGRTIWEKYNTDWNPPVFTPKPLRITDSVGRVLNAKDLWQDMQGAPDPAPKRRYYCRDTWGRARSQKGRAWQKYKGDHSSIYPEHRETHLHLREQSAIRDEYGTTYKIRVSRASNFPCYWDQWERDHIGRRTKGWKRTRKKKQWM